MKVSAAVVREISIVRDDGPCAPLGTEINSEKIVLRKVIGNKGLFRIEAPNDDVDNISADY